MLDFFSFTEMPYPEFPELDKYSAVRLTYPNKYFNPEVGARLYRNYLDQHCLAEEVGFDGVMVNEHHNTPTCLQPSCNISAAALTQRVKRCRILVLGNTIALWENPVRAAEEVAMLDLFSGGRIISGFVRGIGVEQFASNIDPGLNRERFQEAHDLILKTWTEPGPFAWKSKHYEFRYVNPWIFPLQKPHPPIWVPGVGSPETIEWAARQGYPYVVIYSPIETAARYFDAYREASAKAGHSATADKLGFVFGCFVADTQAEVEKSYPHILDRMRKSAKGPVAHYAPIGMGSRFGFARPKSADKSKAPPPPPGVEDLKAGGGWVVGTPDEVTQRMKEIVKRLDVGHLVMESQFCGLPHETAMHSIELLGTKVLPQLRKEFNGRETVSARR